MLPLILSVTLVASQLAPVCSFSSFSPMSTFARSDFERFQAPKAVVSARKLGQLDRRSPLLGRGFEVETNSLLDSSRRPQHRQLRGGRTAVSMASTSQSGVKAAIPFPVRVCVFGGGSFGLAMAAALGRNNIPITIHLRSQDAADSINNDRMSQKYLKGIKLPRSVRATTSAEEALKFATHIVHAIPCQYTRQYLESVKHLVPIDTPVISTSKGIETGTLALMNEILADCLGDIREYAFLSGPSFAKEIATGLATAVVIASESDDLANEVAEMYSSDTFRAFTSRDVEGVEIGGAVKNVIAIAAGMVEGLGLGTNAMAGLVTRGCAEMQLLARTRGAAPSTLMGLSGVGDTFGTCFGPLSRNRQLGYRLGQGEKLEDILASSTEVAEGYATSLSLVDFIEQRVPKGFRMDLKFPIIFGVAEVLKGERTPREGMEDLMLLPLRLEFFDKFVE